MQRIPILATLGSCAFALLLLGSCGSEAKPSDGSSAPTETRGAASAPTQATATAAITGTAAATATAAVATAIAPPAAAPAAVAQTSVPAPTSTPAPPNAPAPTARPPTAVLPTIAPAPTATSAPAGFSLPACYVAGQDRCNCSHFSTQAYAQWFHNNYDPPDVNKLDQNNDGVVCESNR